jgi:hypothetical protein
MADEYEGGRGRVRSVGHVQRLMIADIGVV